MTEPSDRSEARRQLKRYIAIRLGAGLFVLCLLAYYGYQVYLGAGEVGFWRFIKFGTPVVLITLTIYLVQVLLGVRKYWRG